MPGRKTWNWRSGLRARRGDNQGKQLQAAGVQSNPHQRPSCPQPAMPHEMIARRLAARGLVSLAKHDPPTVDIAASATSREVEVIVIIRPVRYEPTSALDSLLSQLRAHGFQAAPLSPSPSPIPAVELTDTDKQILSVLSESFKKKRTIAIEAGYSEHTNAVKTSLAKLVRLNLAANQRGRGYRLA